MSTYQFGHKSELMQNYLHADVMSPQEKFLALQTNVGASLLFSISTEKVFYVTKEVLELLDVEIYIPVISDILDLFGVPRFSLLDIVCFIGAVPTTIAFKLASEQPPFPDNADTRFLIEATDFKVALTS